jgi:cyclophilin family peptidyl-prolyl cis-trans isomerase
VDAWEAEVTNAIIRGLVAAVFLVLCVPGMSLAADKKGAASAEEKNPVVILTTSKGVIEVELDAEKAPISTENFLSYVDDDFYDGTVFHRVIPGFMVQGGGFAPGMDQKPVKAPIKNEADNGRKNERGTLAMARTNVVDSATAQFFINVADSDFLNHSGPGAKYGYAVFGHVTKGMDVVDAIVGVPTGNRGGHGDVPVEDVLLEKAERKE